MEPIFKNNLNSEIHRKGWGIEHWLLNNENLCCKFMQIEKGSKCSLHFHAKKEEIFFITFGSILFVWINTEDGKEESQVLIAGDSVYVPKLLPHQFMCNSEKACFIECSTHHEDSDSYRVRPGDSQTGKK